MRKLRWGILSTSNFARNKMLPALQHCEYAEVAAISSRSLERAMAVARQFGTKNAYGSYDELIADPSLDVIYNPLPNHLHVPWSIKAVEAGKHVLCEKPVAMTAADAEKLLDIASRNPEIKIMEAFMYRFHPQWQHAGKAVRSGEIGELRTVHSFFSYFNRDGNNIRNQPATGGGALMDIGCYNISLSRFLFDSEPRRVLAAFDIDAKFKTDRLTSGVLDFGTGTATFTCSTQSVQFQRVNILGSDGRIELEIPFNAPADKPVRLWHQRGNSLDEILFGPCNQYAIQADQFSLAILNGAPVPTPLSDAVANMRVLDAIRESGRQNAWVAIA
jgi:predicted dehydrogenase